MSRFNSLMRSSAFCLVLFVNVTFALLLTRETRIAREAPPAPTTNTFFSSKVIPSSSRECENPKPSVLWPIFLLLNCIVFTALMSIADWSRSSTSFMTSTLCGIVTFMPSRSVVSMNSFRFSGVTLNASYVCGRFNSLKTALCITADRLWPTGCPISPNFFGSIDWEGLNGL